MFRVAVIVVCACEGVIVTVAVHLAYLVSPNLLQHNGRQSSKPLRLESKTIFKRYLTKEELEKMLYNLEDPIFISNVSSESDFDLDEELNIEAETPINLPDYEEPEDEAAEVKLIGRQLSICKIFSFPKKVNC
ncbi:hypothetical protein ILUMI_25225 [Ignelater luminosus]|uniref:Uncharacterized protein n=1 Tax=Ignelater luminosus TaxID=2038154 RepID=A0A8K0C5U5_IGNLU|nr:hypothetical protein ILUMI_25225 [Ignelater luminosus]